jgi:hypothetical protein
MFVNCKNCDHQCHCESDKVKSEHYTPLMDLCSCTKCEHEIKKLSMRSVYHVNKMNGILILYIIFLVAVIGTTYWIFKD